MRQNNKDIIIHGLVEKSLNLSESKTTKFDYVEELAINEKRGEKVKVLIENQHQKEINCIWVEVMHQECKFQLMVKNGEDPETIKQHFIDKRNQLAKKSV